MGKHTVQTAVVSCPSDNSAELDNDDASGTKRGVMASNVATSLHASATSQESRPLIDCLLIIMGFGLCRAWIVSCLSASVASYSLRTDWVYLLAGAGAAALAGVFINPGLVFPIVLIYCMIITVAMGALASLRFETMEQLV